VSGEVMWCRVWCVVVTIIFNRYAEEYGMVGCGSVGFVTVS
jgi:hypothetical protein